MNELKRECVVILARNNWYLWDRYIKGAIRRKNAYSALSPPPIDPRTVQQAPASAPAPAPAGSTTAAGTSQGAAVATVTTPTDETREMECGE